MFRQFMAHFSLTNDLYSYDKEILEVEEQEAALVNAVYVLQVLLKVSDRTSKLILRSIVLDLENQIQVSYSALLQSKTLNDRQLRYARSMIESLAGNLFHSSTLTRYAGIFPSCRLPI